MKKKMIGLMLAVMLVGNLTACGTGTDSTETVAQEDTNAVEATTGESDGDYVYQDVPDAELTFYQYSVEYVDALEQAIAAYEEIHPNVTINLESVGGGSDWKTALKAKISSGDEPTIIALEGASDFDTFGDMLDDLSAEPWVEHVYENVLPECSVDGKVVAVPAGIVSYGLLYNKAIFEACGIDGETLRSYDAIDQAFTTIQEKIENGELADSFPLLEEVVSFPGAETWVFSGQGANAPLGLEIPSSLDVYKADKIEFKYADAFKDYIDLLIRHTSNRDTPSALNAIDYDSAMGASFCIEKSAVIQMGQWVTPIISEVDATLLDKIGVLPMPMKGVDEDNVCYGVGCYYTVNKNSTTEQNIAARDFLNWLFMSDTGKDIEINVMESNIPMDNYENYSVSNVISKECNKYAEEGNIIPMVFGGVPSGWQEKFGAGIQSYTAGEAEWDEIINDAVTDWSEMR